MIRRPPRSTLDRSSAASDVYKRQLHDLAPGRAGAVRRAGDGGGQGRSGRICRGGGHHHVRRRGLRPAPDVGRGGGEERMTEVREARVQQRRFSPIWLVPIAAVVIAGWLGWKTYN